jgi:hypothetical protein
MGAVAGARVAEFEKRVSDVCARVGSRERMGAHVPAGDAVVRELLCSDALTSAGNAECGGWVAVR